MEIMKCLLTENSLIMANSRLKLRSEIGWVRCVRSNKSVTRYGNYATIVN
jgi:hypothetical protein